MGTGKGPEEDRVGGKKEVRGETKVREAGVEIVGATKWDRETRGGRVRRKG